ncbi:MAG: bifunctional adenosylcobinamide kinase/adenosylcobinamide-phosphate guanylyltransferase [Anaerovibrio sp.]|uniref:bifunctional adenosylcobinamide kinase/adenosylcobinamide-phosphate guanylyltransferase n=1 Tax=Anaerovibrio sp. TaxID=1872532 RepID=UPI0025D5DF79|nr:bifunctional adenosylcobinamide kinase/adenosylcobinamide-phosphate guanylyltransferase [Anaerovibrio sp.]MCR5177249.1 bifunctional adenosylcobinamide kinase/adenosylcobinamide-phosphate guanylyltransferase [Anaerovibrio sp.]
MGKIILVTGGARSGKSSFAERYVAKYGKKIGYIATSQVSDVEMEYRVKLHRERRPKEWKTFEKPFNAYEVIEKQGKSYDMFLFDCMTIYISNILSTVNDIDDFDANYRLVTDNIQQLIKAITASDATVVIVTNEVGSGIVPNSRLAREYRDLSGLTNQMLAQAAEKVYMVISGIPVDIKKISENI